MKALGIRLFPEPDPNEEKDPLYEQFIEPMITVVMRTALLQLTLTPPTLLLDTNVLIFGASVDFTFFLGLGDDVTVAFMVQLDLYKSTNIMFVFFRSLLVKKAVLSFALEEATVTRADGTELTIPKGVSVAGHIGVSTEHPVIGPILRMLGSSFLYDIIANVPDLVFEAAVVSEQEFRISIGLEGGMNLWPPVK